MLNGIKTGFTGTNSNGFFQRPDKYFPVPDFAGFGIILYNLNNFFRYLVFDDHIDLYFGHEVHLVLGTTKHFTVASLPPEALNFSDGHSVHSNTVQGFLDVFKFERFDDGFDFFHTMSSFSD